MIVNMDSLGRVVIPKKIRDRLSLSEFDSLQIEVNNKTIVLTKTMPETIDLEEFINKFIIYKFGRENKDFLVSRDLCNTIENLLINELLSHGVANLRNAQVDNTPFF